MSDTALELRPRWESAVLERTQHGYRLDAEQDWLLTGDDSQIRDICEALPARVCDMITPACVRLRFGNSVGHFKLPHLGVLEVRSGKWDESHFERMLAELTDVAASLPFAGRQGGALPYDRSLASRHDVLYHAFVYLRHILDDAAPAHERLLPELEAILREPHRWFRVQQREVSLWSARRTTARGLQRLAEGRVAFRRAAAGEAPLLASAFGGHLPERIEETLSESTFDTAENRFVKAFLEQALGVIEEMARVSERNRSLGPKLRQDCEEMHRKLTPHRRAALWSEVGTMVHFPASSTVLQQRRGYKGVFRHALRMRLSSRLPLDSRTARDLLEVKDIAELYELWCYFTVVDELRAIESEPIAAESQLLTSATDVIVPWSFRVRWRSGVEIFYNHRYSRSRSAAQRSYSLPLRPDIALRVPDGPGKGLHLLDAKFRLRRIDALFSDGEDPRDEERSRAAGFKRDDLYKMHAYRDAIPHARSAWVLYPGTEVGFFSATGGDFDGVGAIPLLPAEGERSELRRVLAGLIGVGCLSRRSTPPTNAA